MFYHHHQNHPYIPSEGSKAGHCCRIQAASPFHKKLGNSRWGTRQPSIIIIVEVALERKLKIANFLPIPNSLDLKTDDRCQDHTIPNQVQFVTLTTSITSAPAILYRLIEELITRELIYRFLASFIIRANLSSCDSLNCGVLGLQFHTPQKLVGEPRAYFAYIVDLPTQAASQQ